MQPRNPRWEARVREIFERAPFVIDLGTSLDEVDVGRCVTSLVPQPRHRQQDGFVHAGVLATLADHTAGAAAGGVVAAGETILTIEFKVNFLRPAAGDLLRCRATVLKPGRTIVVAESDVVAMTGEHETLVAKALVTLAVVRLGQPD